MHLSAFLSRLGAQERSGEDHREELVFFFSQDRKEQEGTGRKGATASDSGQGLPGGTCRGLKVGMKTSGVLPRSTRTWP